MAEKQDDKVVESPTLTEGKEIEGAETPSPEDQVEERKALMAELDKLEITSPERLQGMAQASYQAGNTANLLGEANAENARLQAQITQLQQPQTQQTHQPEQYVEGQTVDINAAMTQAIEKVLPAQLDAAAARMNRQAVIANQAQFEEYAKIQGDPDYKVIGPAFEQHVQNPAVQMQLRTGQTTMDKVYSNVQLTWYRKIAERSKNALQGMGTVTQAGTGAPHMEAGHTQVTPQPQQATEYEDKIKKITDNWTGTDKDVEAVLDAMLPDTDPFFPQG